jgi:hypothetical protein
VARCGRLWGGTEAYATLHHAPQDGQSQRRVRMGARQVVLRSGAIDFPARLLAQRLGGRPRNRYAAVDAHGHLAHDMVWLVSPPRSRLGVGRGGCPVVRRQHSRRKQRAHRLHPMRALVAERQEDLGAGQPRMAHQH